MIDSFWYTSVITNLIAIIFLFISLFILFTKKIFGKNYRTLLILNLIICFLFQISSLARELCHIFFNTSILSKILNEISLLFSLMTSLSNVTMCLERICSFLLRKSYEKHENKKVTKLIIICLVFVIVEPVISKYLIINKHLTPLFNMILLFFLQFLSLSFFCIVVYKNTQIYKVKMTEKHIQKSLSEKYQIVEIHKTWKSISLIAFVSILSSLLSNIYLIIITKGNFNFLLEYKNSLTWQILANVGIIIEGGIIVFIVENVRNYFLEICLKKLKNGNSKDEDQNKISENGDIYFKNYASKW
uniref:G-protein coupled receptors family 1 profile domain-containing protein n=2 Tax=Strongyloides stercoralis TaxID=6248 RepID=A0A0K0DYQ5_STRER